MDTSTSICATGSQAPQPHRGAASKTINLALQGGGAHGAFTWGVLDRLLEDERIDFEGISATSAGAMNAAVLAYGLADGGREGAQEGARAISGGASAHAALFSPLQPSPFDRLTHNHGARLFAGLLVFDLMTRLLSPYQFNPLNFNPLRARARAVGRFRARCAAARPSSCSCRATNVRTGKIKVFTNDEIDGGRRDGLGLPAVHVPGGRDRRRGLLGRRLHGQSRHLPADLWLRVAGRADRAHQPDRAAAKCRRRRARS